MLFFPTSFWYEGDRITDSSGHTRVGDRLESTVTLSQDEAFYEAYQREEEWALNDTYSNWLTDVKGSDGQTYSFISSSVDGYGLELTDANSPFSSSLRPQSVSIYLFGLEDDRHNLVWGMTYDDADRFEETADEVIREAVGSNERLCGEAKVQVSVL